MSIIRKINPSGIISKIGGTGTAGYSGDGGPATAAQLYAPQGLITDSVGNLFFVNCINWCVRKIDTAGIITTVAGNGSNGFSGDGGSADSAELYRPSDVAVLPNGDFYISDGCNNRIRKVHTSLHRFQISKLVPMMCTSTPTRFTKSSSAFGCSQVRKPM